MTPRPKTQDPLYQAQAILSRRDHSTFELQQKLARKKFSPDDIAAALTKLKRLNLLNDQLFAEQYAQNTLATKAVGPRWLHQKLRRKGIATNTITAVVAAAYTNSSERDMAQQAARRWQRTHSRYAADSQRLGRFLTARGFSSAVITSVIGEGSAT